MTIEGVKKKIVPGKMICFIVLANPVVEMIYCTLYRMNVDIPVNQFFRICGFLIFLGCVKKKKTRVTVAFLAGMYGAVWMAQIAAGFSVWSFREIVFIVKAVYAVSLIFIFRDFIECNTVEKESLVRAAVLSAIVIMVSVCISPLGLGYAAWENTDYRTGYVGLFLFGNYLTVVLLVVFCLAFSSKLVKHKAIFTCFLLLTIILLGNKAGLAGIFIYAAGLWVFYICVLPKGRKKRMFLLASIVVLALAVPPSVRFLGKFVENQIQMYEAYGYTNIGSFLLSNRDMQLSAVRGYIDEKNYNRFLGGLIGYGYTNLNTVLKAKRSWMNFIEMDFFALRYYLGYAAVLVWAYIDLTLICTSVRTFIRERKIGEFCICLGILMAIAHSFLTGHVIFESLTVVYFSVLGAVILCNKDSMKKNVQEKTEVSVYE